MNDLEFGKLIARVDNLEDTTAERHEENKIEIKAIQLKLDLMLGKLSELRGGWFVLSILGAIGVAAITLLLKVFGLKFGG